MNWREYENEILGYLKTKHPDAIFTKNAKLMGKLSDTPRDIDILLETEVFGLSFQVAVECKKWSSKLDVADIGSFIDKLKDVGISRGIMFSKSGYSQAAYRRAKKEIEVNLHVLDFENINNYYGFWGIAYRGNIGAVISATNGWIVNNNIPDESLINCLCYIHPYEFSLEEAFQNKCLCYFQLYPIVDNINLKDNLTNQDLIVKKRDPKATIEYWEEKSVKGKITYRKIHEVESQYVEFTGAVESDDFFAYCVCVVPQTFIPDDLTRLQYIMKELILIKLDKLNPLNSHSA